MNLRYLLRFCHTKNGRKIPNFSTQTIVEIRSQNRNSYLHGIRPGMRREPGLAADGHGVVPRLGVDVCLMMGSGLLPPIETAEPVGHLLVAAPDNVVVEAHPVARWHVRVDRRLAAGLGLGRRPHYRVLRADVPLAQDWRRWLLRWLG